MAKPKTLIKAEVNKSGNAIVYKIA